MLRDYEQQTFPKAEAGFLLRTTYTRKRPNLLALSFAARASRDCQQGFSAKSSMLNFFPLALER